MEAAFVKLKYDLFYLKNMSLFFDTAILIRTVRIVLFGHEKRSSDEVSYFRNPALRAAEGVFQNSSAEGTQIPRDRAAASLK